MSNKARSDRSPHHPPMGADLYGEMFLADLAEERVAKPKIADYIPGMMVVSAAAGAAAWLSETYDFPVILAGLLIGLALNFIADIERVHAGFDLCTTTLLRWGIVLLGFQLTAAQFSALGIAPFAALIAIMALVIGTGWFAAKWSGQPVLSGLLVGCATAICGASAALAVYAIIGRHRLGPHRLTVALVGITLASALAMALYPLIAASIGFSDRQAGFLMGAAIHDVAQALGGGYSFSEGAGETATIVKLTRVALLAPIVAIVGVVLGSKAATRGVSGKQGFSKALRLPWFILAFFAVVALNSLVDLPAGLAAPSLTLSKALLLFAIIAIAMRSRPAALLAEGWKPMVPVAAAMLVSFGAALLAAWMLL